MPEFNQTDRLQETVFDVDAERLARVYAEAGLGAAGDLVQQESLVIELESVVADVLGRNPRLEQVFASELVSGEDKLAMLDRIFAGRASDALLKLLKVVAKHKRLNILRDIAKSARKIFQARAGRVPVQLETANPIEMPLQQEILKAFGNALGADPIVTQRVNADLIAGFVLRVGDIVYDGSVRTRLEQLRQGMISSTVEAIQRGPRRFINTED